MYPFDGLAYPFVTLENDVLRPVPVSITLRALQVCTVTAIQVLEYPVLITESAVLPLYWWVLDSGEVSSLLGRRGESGCGGGGGDDAVRSGGKRLGGGRLASNHGCCGYMAYRRGYEMVVVGAMPVGELSVWMWLHRQNERRRWKS